MLPLWEAVIRGAQISSKEETNRRKRDSLNRVNFIAPVQAGVDPVLIPRSVPAVVEG
jgi:hypothetical protein